MPHDTPLISTIVAGLVLAFIFGALANRLRMPPLVGYLVAGILVGPHSPGFVADTELATELSELGVILLMFGVGLNFSLKDMVSVQALAVPGALIRIVLATAMGTGLGFLLGWPVQAGLLFGLALSVASTVVVLKALHDRHLIDSDKGRITVGWVIVEDVAMVLALVLIPALASVWGMGAGQLNDPFVNLIEQYAHVHLGPWGIVGVTVVKLAAFVGFMLVVGRRLIPLVLHLTAHTGSRELFRLAVLAIALGVAAGATYLFGISLALGAFFAGMILSESELSQRAAQETLPLRDAFAVLFFVSVGMLFDPAILWDDPLPVLGTLAIILVGKAAVSYFSILAFGRSQGTALTVTAGLAQIGEFSFILATLGLSFGIFDTEARDLIVAGAMISIILNPVLFWLADVLRPRLEPASVAAANDQAAEPAVPASAPSPDEAMPEPTRLSGHVVLVGYGRVGSVVAQGLVAAKRPFVTIEDADDRVAAARAAGLEVIVGNAANPKVLNLANLEGATTAVIAIPNTFEAGQATQQCRHHNAGLFIIARAHSDEEEQYLLGLGANQVIMGEREIALGMVETITRDTQAVAEVVAAEAVEAALAPVAGAAAEHGPDIFAPAVELPHDEVRTAPAAVGNEDEEPAPPASAPSVETAGPQPMAEVITPDFGHRRAPALREIIASQPEPADLRSEDAGPRIEAASEQPEGPGRPESVERPDEAWPAWAAEPATEEPDDRPVATADDVAELALLEPPEPVTGAGVQSSAPEAEAPPPEVLRPNEPVAPGPTRPDAYDWQPPRVEPVEVTAEQTAEGAEGAGPSADEPASAPERTAAVLWESIAAGDSDPWEVRQAGSTGDAGSKAAEAEGQLLPAQAVPEPSPAETDAPLAGEPAEAGAADQETAAEPAPFADDEAVRETAQAAVEGSGPTPRRPVPFGPSTTAGNPFAAPPDREPADG